MRFKNRFRLARQARSDLSYAGFTLVELLAVLAIVALLMATTTNLCRGVLDSRNFAASSTAVAGYLNFARAKAIAENSYVVVGFHPATSDGADDLQVLGFCALNGSYDPDFSTATNPPRYAPIGRPTHLGNLQLTATGSLSSGMTSKLASAGLTPDNSTIYDASTVSTADSALAVGAGGSSPDFTQSLIVFTPQGDALVAGETIPSLAKIATLPVYKDVVIGLRLSRGGRVSASSSDQNSAAVVIDSGTGRISVYQP